MAAVLTHGKGFYRPLVYVLECHRLGLRLLPPDVNRPGPGFVVEAGAIRVPVAAVKHLGGGTLERLEAERAEAPFASADEFIRRVRPSSEAVEALLRVGALDALAPGTSRTALAWELLWAREGTCGRTGSRAATRQRELVLPAAGHGPPPVVLHEPSRVERLDAEAELLGYTVSGHPLERYPDIAWETYCPVAELGTFSGRKVTCCGLVVEDRTTHQTSGELMKFMTLVDRSGIVETELFAEGYRRHGLITLRYPVLEVEATVEPFENGGGHTLRIHSVRRPRTRNGRPAPEYGLEG
jgi:DNA polymerase III alpha subunit